MPKLRLLVDHNVGHGVALALAAAGHDVVFAGDVDPHLSDVAIL
jgi:predicted dinucleotide-binding enzyme